MTTLSNFKPLLAAGIDTVEDFNSLQYPMYASPKYDGIRLCMDPSRGPVTRSLKSVPNKYIREYLSNSHFRFIDCEIMVGPHNAPNVCNVTQSGVMSHDGYPNFSIVVFDHFEHPTSPYSSRLIQAQELVKEIRRQDKGDITRVYMSPQYLVSSADEVAAIENEWLSAGYEGVMLRSPEGIYKFGRSTLKQQILLKLKRFTDDEGEIVGWEPLERNENEAFLDERGYQKRSSHIAGKREDDTRIGKFHLRGLTGRWKDVHFKCGSGLSDDQRLEYRKNIDSLIGKKVTYKYQAHGSISAPRAPIFKCIRGDE